jgi:hypothetical protein
MVVPITGIEMASNGRGRAAGPQHTRLLQIMTIIYVVVVQGRKRQTSN